jgi:Uma2 family endonuclease
MGHAAIQPRRSAADFLAWDAQQSLKHEFVRGAVFAMAGADERHVTAAGNLYLALRAHLRGTACRTYIADMKLRVEAADAYFYPDVMVCCDAADAADPLVKRAPVLVVEVLSASTAAFDRGDKFAAYRTLPALREYLLADPATRRCDLYRKGDDGLWVLHPSGPDEPVMLASVGLTLTPELLWAEVEATPAPDAGAGAA